MKTGQRLFCVMLCLMMVTDAIAADAHSLHPITRRTVRATVGMMNRHYWGERPTAQDYDALANQLVAWTEHARSNGTLAAFEAQVLAHPAVYVHSRPKDATRLYRHYVAHGYQGSKLDIQDALDRSTRAGHRAFVEHVQRYGMYATALALAEQVRQIPARQALLWHPQLRPVMLDWSLGSQLNFFKDASCSDWGAWGSDLMALGGIALVFGQEEAAGVLAGVGGVIWLYSRYACY